MSERARSGTAPPATWPEVLDRLEDDAVRLAAAAAEADPEALAGAHEAALDVAALDLPPLPLELADRAREVLQTLTDATAAVARQATNVRRGIGTVGATTTAPPSRYIDRRV